MPGRRCVTERCLLRIDSHVGLRKLRGSGTTPGGTGRLATLRELERGANLQLLPDAEKMAPFL